MEIAHTKLTALLPSSFVASLEGLELCLLHAGDMLDVCGEAGVSRAVSLILEMLEQARP